MRGLARMSAVTAFDTRGSEQNIAEDEQRSINRL